MASIRKKLGRPKGKFTQHRRLDRLREALDSHPSGLTLVQMAMLAQVSLRSAQRYLRELGRELELEALEEESGRATVWRIKPSERARTVPLRRSQAYALLALRPHFGVLRGTALYDEIELGLGQIQRLSERPTRTTTKGDVAHDAGLERRFAFFPGPTKDYIGREDDIDTLFQAVAERRTLSFQHQGRARAVHPYGIAVADGGICIIGFEPESARIEPYALESVSTLAMTTRRFDMPKDFDIRKLRLGPFGWQKDGDSQVVVVEFAKAVADRIRGLVIHPDQKLAQARDGRLRLRFPSNDLEAVRHWVLSFGPSARVLEPLELVDVVRRSLDAARRLYD